MKLETYYLSREENISYSALIYAVFKKEPVFIAPGGDLSCIRDDSVVIIMPDYPAFEDCKSELGSSNTYIIRYIEENLINPIRMNNTLIISTPVCFSSLFKAIDILGIKKRRKKKQIDEFYWGKTDAMKELKNLADRSIKGECSIHITGEMGSGKTMLANYLAEGREIVSLNCSCLDGSLVMDSLFGHVKGAFTGADKERIGLCREADGKILFLDELQDLPYSVQAMLLRVLENGKMRPLGSDKEIRVHFKLITASSLPMKELKERIRRDLLSRIGIITLTIPPLRERKEDIPELMKRKSRELTRKMGAHELSDLEPWINYNWEGNIRELYSKLEYAFVAGKTPDELGGVSTIKEKKKKIERLPSLEELMSMKITDL